MATEIDYRVVLADLERQQAEIGALINSIKVLIATGVTTYEFHPSIKK
jgi:hypothetical protein